MEWYTTESPSVIAYMLGVSPTTCISDVPNMSLAFFQTYEISVGSHDRVMLKKDFSSATSRKSSVVVARVPRIRAPADRCNRQTYRHVQHRVHQTVRSLVQVYANRGYIIKPTTLEIGAHDVSKIVCSAVALCWAYIAGDIRSRVRKLALPTHKRSLIQNGLAALSASATQDVHVVMCLNHSTTPNASVPKYTVKLATSSGNTFTFVYTIGRITSSQNSNNTYTTALYVVTNAAISELLVSENTASVPIMSSAAAQNVR